MLQISPGEVREPKCSNRSKCSRPGLWGFAMTPTGKDHGPEGAAAPPPGTVADAAPGVRRRLPNRRECEIIAFEHGGIRFQAGVGRFATGELAEIFLTVPGKVGSQADVNARDAAIAASLLLQHGCPVRSLRRALTRNGDGSAGSPLAAALDLLAAEDGEQ